MAGCDPSRQIVFNWCDEVPGIPRSSALVARKLEELSFTFTAPARRLSCSVMIKLQSKNGLKMQEPHTLLQVFTGEETLDWDCFPAVN